MLCCCCSVCAPFQLRVLSKEQQEKNVLRRLKAHISSVDVDTVSVKVYVSIAKNTFPFPSWPLRFATHVENTMQMLEGKLLVASNEVIISTGGSGAILGIAIDKQYVSHLKEALCKPHAFRSQRQAVHVREANRDEKGNASRYAFLYKGFCPPFSLLLDACYDAGIQYCRVFGVGLKMGLDANSQPSGRELLKFLCTPGVCYAECTSRWPKIDEQLNTPLIDVAIKLDHGYCQQQGSWLPVFAVNESTSKPKVVLNQQKFYGLYGSGTHGTVKVYVSRDQAEDMAHQYANNDGNQRDPREKGSIGAFLDAVEKSYGDDSRDSMENNSALYGGLAFGVHAITLYNGDVKANLNTFFLHRHNTLFENLGNESGFRAAFDCMESAFHALQTTKVEERYACRFEVTFTRLLDSWDQYERYCRCLWILKHELLGVTMVKCTTLSLDLYLCIV